MGEMTKADAAKLVRRLVPKLDKEGKPIIIDGKPAMTEGTVREDEVLSFKDYGDHAIVVTNDGQKLRGDKKK